jgi:rhodanese-related sulfurtransferase
MTIKTAKELVAAATASVETLPAEMAVKLLGQPNVVFVDVRETAELEKTGKLKGAVEVSRGLLEFQADPASPGHLTELHPARQLVLFCASGGRSALAAKTLKDMGFEKVSHVAGGFPAIKNAGGKTEGGA